MKIDARTMHSDAYRPYTVCGAVAAAMDGMKVGDIVDVEAFVDQLGRNVPTGRLSMYVSKLSNGRRFSVRRSPSAVATLYRIA